MRANIPKLATDRGTRSPWIHDRFLLPVSSVIRAALTISIPKTMKTFGGLQHSLKMHEAIIDAIEARDETRASEAATLLISATYQRNFSLFLPSLEGGTSSRCENPMATCRHSLRNDLLKALSEPKPLSIATLQATLALLDASTSPGA
jgi:hypothetical protein